VAPHRRWPPSTRIQRTLDVGVAAATAILGLALLVAGSSGVDVVAGPLRPSTVVLAIAAGAVLTWRRSRPLTVVGLLVVVVVVAAGVAPPGLAGLQVVLAFVVAAYALGSWSEHRAALAVVGTVLVAATVWGQVADGSSILVGAAVALTLLALPIVAGTAARARRRELEEVSRRLVESEARQEERALLAIQDERNRIARELHDVVAHHVSLIGVQAGAARASLGSSPERTRDALAAIEQSSREAVGEMHQLVDVLQPRDEPNRAPQPGLADLDELVGRWRAVGYAIAFDPEVARSVGEVAPTLSLSCYRLVEEALTNVARHSQARSASVAVRPGPGTIEVAVLDPGPPSAAATTDAGMARAGGRGLVGMAERAALFGGRVAAGPTPEGGFAVVASMPLAGG
jgi:signal transduction histidine kinase